MDLDRGTLARIDRRLLSKLGHKQSFRMVRVPATEAEWFTWKRYCDAAGISMGRAIMALIDRELVGLFAESAGEGGPMFSGRAEEQLAARETHVADRECDLEAAEQRLRECTERLRLWVGELEAQAASQSNQGSTASVERRHASQSGAEDPSAPLNEAPAN